MEKLTRLFGRSIRFAYHGFDRIVIRGYLSTLSRYTHLYFYIIDEVLGPFAMRIGAYSDRFKVQCSEVQGCQTKPVSGRFPTSEP